MKFKFVLSLFLLGSSLSVFAQGYKDGVEYYKVNQFDKAKILLERNLNDPSTDKSLSYFYLGFIATKNNKLEEAKDYFNKGISANPENGFNYIGLGALDLKAGNEKAADNNFSTALGKDKKNALIPAVIARVYYNASPVTYAKQIAKYIERAKKIDKRNPDVYILEGDMLTADKKWGDAAGYYEMAQSFDNNCSEAYVKYANTYFNVSPKVAIEKLRDLIAINPNSALAQRELAEKLYEDDQWTNAAEVYGSYIKNPNHFKEDEERYAVLLYFGKKNDESLALAAKILSTSPNSFLMKRIVFLNQAALGKYAEAEQTAKQFFGSTDPNNKYSANDYTTYGDVLKELGKSEESLAMYEKAVELNPDKIELLKDLSSAYGNNKDYVKSAFYYQKFINHGNFSTNDLYVLAGKYQNVLATATTPDEKQAGLDSALRYIDIVIAKVPNDYRIPQRKARILRLSETGIKEGKAIPAYTSMIAILDENPENKTKNVDAYQEGYMYIIQNKIDNGDNAAVKEYAAKYLEIDPSNKELRDFVDKLK